MASDVSSAPYADTAIPLHLSSTTGMRYRTLNCMECGHQFLERNNDTMYRLGDSSQPAEIAISAGVIVALCGHCQQIYHVIVALAVATKQDDVPLHMQPQSIYISIEENKKLRYTHCLECGHAFHSISDRISQVTDNRVPFEYLAPNRMGPMEAICSSNNCRQSWSLMV